METLVDLSSTNSTWLLETDRWLIWTLGEQREIRKGVGGLGRGKGVFLLHLHFLSSCAAQGCSGQSPALSSWS